MQLKFRRFVLFFMMLSHNLISGGSRGGACPPLYFETKLRLEGLKKNFGRPLPSYLRIWMTAPCLSQGLDSALFNSPEKCFYKANIVSFLEHCQGSRSLKNLRNPIYIQEVNDCSNEVIQKQLIIIFIRQLFSALFILSFFVCFSKVIIRNLHSCQLISPLICAMNLHILLQYPTHEYYYKMNQT